MPARDADATRARLLEAARAEFSAHGIAGARVDRIAAAARSNKAQIYHYFGSKDALFDAVLGSYVEGAVEDYFDAEDLPETAARICERFEAQPDAARIATWYRLERAGEGEPIESLLATNQTKVRLIRAAQASGHVTDELSAEVLLGLVVTIAAAWSSLPPEFTTLGRRTSAGRRREIVREAVARLVAP